MYICMNRIGTNYPVCYLYHYQKALLIDIEISIFDPNCTFRLVGTMTHCSKAVDLPRLSAVSYDFDSKMKPL